MTSVRSLLTRGNAALHMATFDDRPGKLFEGLQHCRSVIFVALGGSASNSHTSSLFTSKYHRWNTHAREYWLPQLEYTSANGDVVFSGIFPKYSSDTHAAVIHRLANMSNSTIGGRAEKFGSMYYDFYQESVGYWTKVTVGLPYYSKDGVEAAPAHGRYAYFAKASQAAAASAILNSSVFYCYFIAYGDCFHLSDSLVMSYPIPKGILDDNRLALLGRKLNKSLKDNAANKTIQTRDGSSISYAEFRAGESKPIIDEIDTLLAEHYGFTPEELDFIINYDIKYRMGAEAAGGEDDDA